MKSIYACIVSLMLLTTSIFASAQTGDLSLNGMAAFEQLRKEYYIGALYLGWPGRDPAEIANMPGKKRMQINITADRWPSLRFAQMWNQAITINNPGAAINANALDILAFTSLPKADLVAGDHLVIELRDNSTLVYLNDTPALRTNSPALFNLLLNAWIGPRPPTSEFKRDILDLPKDQAANDLAARFNTVRPSEARKKVIAGWGFKIESETAAAATEMTVAASAATAAAPTPKKPDVVETKAEQPAAKPATETKAVAEAKPIPAQPKAVAPQAEKSAPAAPQPPQPDAAALAAKAAHEKEQTALNNEYAGIVRNRVVRNINYPRRAVKDNIEGLVMVRIKTNRDGELMSVEVAQSADDLLDAESLRAVKKAAPFPKASDSLEGDSFELIVPIVFKLTQ